MRGDLAGDTVMRPESDTHRFARRAPVCRRTGRRGGFTIIELLVVFLVIAILAGMIAPAMMRGVRLSKLRAGASGVATALRRARNLSIASGEIYCARFVNGDVPTVENYRLSETEMNGPSSWGALTTSGGVNLPKEVRFGTVPSFIYFLPDGSAWGPGMVVPAAVKVVHRNPSSSGSDYFNVTVRSLSGRIEIRKRK